MEIILMSRTYRKHPLGHQHIRHPKINNERRQLETLKTDRRFFDYSISPLNRISKHLPDEFNKLTASSNHELHHRT